MGFSRLEHGFLAYNPFPLYDLGFVQGILDSPESGGQLDGILALVFDRNSVAKSKMDPIILIEGPFEIGFDGDLDASGYLLYHLNRSQKMQPEKRRLQSVLKIRI